MINRVEAGMRGQRAAEAHIVEKGYQILARNYRIRTGEIDIIARDGAYIVFIEVKYRNDLRYGLPRESVHYNKQRHIKRTALHYITVRGLSEQDFRFDVIEIIREDGLTRITHLENAFQ